MIAIELGKFASKLDFGTLPVGVTNAVKQPILDVLASALAGLPFAVSLMLSKGHAGSEEFTEKYLSDPDIRDLSRKVRYEVDPKYQVEDMQAGLR